MGRRGPPARAAPRADARLGRRARPGRVRGPAHRRRDPRHRAGVPGPDVDLGLRARLGLARVQPLAPGPLRGPRQRVAARARRRPALADEVEALVRVHEEGGWHDADVLQAADSLSFLETMVPLVLGWSERGYADNAAAKLRHSLERIAPELTPARAARRPARRARAGRAARRRRARDRAAGHAGRRRRGARPRPGARGRRRSSAQGRMFRLARERFPGMPLFPGHPPFQVLSYRTPQGIRAAGDQPWGPVQRRGAGLHERARARQPAHRRPHRRARAT